MSIGGHLINYVLRAGGFISYYAAKASVKLVNINKRHLNIDTDIINKISFFFPSLDLYKVCIIKNSSLPANWFNPIKRIAGMTFAQDIYLKSDLQYDYEEIKLLIHELCHVQQIRKIGEMKFAARYGEELVRYGYPEMPLEKEAYDFVSNIPFDPVYYLNANNDVNITVNGSYTRAFAHWLDCGIDDGRNSTNYFNAAKYLNNHADLLSSYGERNFKAGVIHWIKIGKNEGRKGN